MVKKNLTRPLSEFNKYEAIDILETLQNIFRDNQEEKCKFHRLVYLTAYSKGGSPAPGSISGLWGYAY